MNIAYESLNNIFNAKRNTRCKDAEERYVLCDFASCVPLCVEKIIITFFSRDRFLQHNKILVIFRFCEKLFMKYKELRKIKKKGKRYDQAYFAAPW
jgi:hypothetical protein